MKLTVGVLVEFDRVLACAVRRGRTLWAAEATYTDPPDLARVLAALAAERPPGVRGARVVLAPGVARCKDVKGLPALRHADLTAHVQLNSRRYFLQNGVPLLTDARWFGGVARLAAVPEPIANAVADGLQAAGLRLEALTPRNEPVDDRLAIARAAAGTAAADLSLLPLAHRERVAAGARLSLRRLAMAAAASALCSLALAWGMLVRRERHAEADWERVAPAVASASAVQRDLDAVSDVLAELESTRPLTTRLQQLAALAAALPDSAVLVTISIDRSGLVRVTGYAPSATRTLARLSRALGVTEAAFDGPVTREVVAGRELDRYGIRLRMGP